MRSLFDLAKCAFAFRFADDEAANMLSLGVLLLLMCRLLGILSFLRLLLCCFLIWTITIIIFE